MSKMSKTSNQKSSLRPVPLALGLLLSPTLPTSLLLHEPNVQQPLTSNIILLLSLADPGGAFDIPVEKCPLGGSVGHVTGVPPSVFSNKPLSKVFSSDASLYRSPSSPPTAPIHFTNPRQPSNRQLVTPPSTPGNTVAIPHPQKSFAFANSVFPEQSPTISKFVVPLQILSESAWDAFILSLPNRPKTLYVDGQSAQLTNLRESIVALLDLADEQLECSAVIIALPRTSEGLDDLIHSLMYVGGQIVTRPPFKAGSAYLLVGMEI